MHENQEVNIVSRDNTNSLIELCLQTEQDRGLSKNSIIELKRYLNDFATYCECQNIYSVKDLTPPFLKDYIDQRCKSAGPNLKKAIVWSLRKFGKHLALLQVVEDNPAKNLRHPKFHPRSELPEYLSTSQLKNLLEYAANNLELRDFAIISLMATTGLRPNEIAGCKQNNVHLNRHCIHVRVKGGWIKETPISASMSSILTNYLATRKDDCQTLFVNTRGRLSFSKLDSAYRKSCREKYRTFNFFNLQSSPTYLRNPCCRPKWQDYHKSINGTSATGNYRNLYPSEPASL